ncbi:MAG: NAD(P)/FAD-dependent oxidoreductase [Coriobacteriia bacterium]|nr:NAD(P)/FAD-dependent oxidoreductase [Coriobacteriia bacterium]
MTLEQRSDDLQHTPTGKSVVVIGTGAAGTASARALASAGFDVTVIERGKVGGTCLWHGCMPKKALYTAAAARRERVRSEQFGLSACDPEFDWPTVLAWKWHVQETYAGDQGEGFRSRGIALVKGSARFLSPDTIEVDGKVFEPDHIIIATGSRPTLPPIDGIGLSDTSDDAIGFPEPPATLLIVGGGFIGTEFAAIYASFGTRVTLVTSAERLLDMLDAEVAAIATHHLAQLGVEVHVGCRMGGLSGTRGAVGASFTDTDSNVHEGTYERVLVATGRAPALADLDCEAAGIETDGRGHVVVDRFLRTTNPRVWVAGDAAGGMMQTPVAAYEGRTIAESIATGSPVAPDCSVVPTAVFTSPQIAQVGMSEESATAAGISYRVSRLPYEYLGAAIAEDVRDGLVKLLFAEKDDRLLGAHIAGYGASDLIYAMAIAMRHEATSVSLRETIAIHPAFHESLNWASY